MQEITFTLYCISVKDAINGIKKLKEAHSDADFHAVYGIGYKLV